MFEKHMACQVQRRPKLTPKLHTIASLSTHVGYRVYSNFFMPDRLERYRSLMQSALQRNYEVHSLLSFGRLVERGAVDAARKYIVLRHDVDTDARTARKIWQLEVGLGIRSSYYFRKATLDISLMQEIHASGSEASYHYEELSTIAKTRGFTAQKQVEAALPEIRELFRANLMGLRKATGLPMLTVASHGDFVNRRLGIPNTMIMEDQQLRRQLSIVLEAYDGALLQRFAARCSDSMYPPFWSPDNPENAILCGRPVVYILIHPRQWHANVLANMREDAVRCWEALSYRWAACCQAG